MNNRSLCAASLVLGAVFLLAACGTEGQFGNASFTVGKGWDQDNSMPIALGSVFEAAARESNAFGQALRIESANEAVIAPAPSGVAGEFEAVGVGTAELVARTEAGTELDRLRFEVAAPASVGIAHWTDLSLDPSSRITGDVAAVGGSKVGLKILVADSSGRQVHHLGIASLVSNSGHPVNIDPSSDGPTLSIGAAGTGKFSAKVNVKGGAPLLDQHNLSVLAESDLSTIEIASGAVTIGQDGEGTPAAQGGRTAKMHLLFVRCSDPGGKRAYGCAATWSKVSGDANLLLSASKPSEFNWVELSPDQEVAVKATVGGLTSTKTVKYAQ